jgi:hypothetical protein
MRGVAITSDVYSSATASMPKNAAVRVAEQVLFAACAQSGLTVTDWIARVRKPLMPEAGLEPAWA